MRITPVTGDLPAVAVSPPPPVRHATGLATPTATAPVEQTTAPRTDADATAAERHLRSALPFFDPPLIAQRAALGLPTGLLVADLARAKGIPYSAASAAVDRAMPQRPEQR